MNLREAPTQVKSLERLELETVSRPTQTLVRKLLGPDASFKCRRRRGLIHGETYVQHEPGAVIYH